MGNAILRSFLYDYGYCGVRKTIFLEKIHKKKKNTQHIFGYSYLASIYDARPANYVRKIYMDPVFRELCHFSRNNATITLLRETAVFLTIIYRRSPVT